MRRMRELLVICAWITAMLAVQPVWAVLNNGFQTDYIYASSNSGQIQIFNEFTGASPGNLVATGTWYTLTFSGTGSSDARLFVAKSGSGDITVAEIDSTGSTVKTASLKAIIGTPVPAWTTAAGCGTIRYSSLHDSLFVGVTPANTAGTWKTAMVYEIDLGLSTLLYTYAGEDIETRVPVIDIDAAGMLYMTGESLGGDQYAGSPTNVGDLIAFNTAGRLVGGTTTTYTKLINGYVYNQSDANYIAPHSLAYRGTNNPSGHPTILIMTNRSAGVDYPDLEFYLDQTDGNGNLVKRGQPVWAKRGWPGQLDEVSKAVWFADQRDRVRGVRFDDTTTKCGTVNSYWYDADSPYTPPPWPPVIRRPVTDPDAAAANFEYARQLILEQGTPVTWTLPQGPTGAMVDTHGRVSGWTPTADDVGQTFAFQVQASNGAGSDTLSWNVNVYNSNNGFIADFVYAVIDTAAAPPTLYMYNQSTGGGGSSWSVGGLLLFSLTFTGEGRNKDARLFVMAPLDLALPSSSPDGGNYDDVRVAELNSAGEIIHSGNLSAIVGQPLGTNVVTGNIRYSSLHNSLFISVNPLNDTSWKAAKVYEIDLGLTTLLHTYVSTGEDVQTLQVNIAIAPDGKMYMTNQNMGGTASQGDVIAFDTAGRAVGGTTTSYTVLVDGPTFAVGHTQWNNPRTVIFREGGYGRDDGTDTLLVPLNPTGNPEPVQEFYLDTVQHPVDGDGNLALRGSPISTKRGWNGQQDVSTGDVWIGTMNGGIRALRFNDDNTTDIASGNGWSDAARTPYDPCNVPSVDIDGDTDVDQDDFAVFQLCYSPTPPTGGLTAQCSCFDRGDDNANGKADRDGDIDRYDYVVFENCSSGPGIAANPACAGS